MFIARRSRLLIELKHIIRADTSTIILWKRAQGEAQSHESLGVVDKVLTRTSNPHSTSRWEDSFLRLRSFSVDFNSSLFFCFGTPRFYLIFSAQLVDVGKGKCGHFLFLYVNYYQGKVAFESFNFAAQKHIGKLLFTP